MGIYGHHFAGTCSALHGWYCVISPAALRVMPEFCGGVNVGLAVSVDVKSPQQ